MSINVLDELQGRRTVTLTNNINQKQSSDLRARLLELDLESDKEIRLLIDSDGGYNQAALSVYDTIRSLRSPVTAIVIGVCFSMAAVVLQACEKRLALKHAMFLLHHGDATFSFSYHLSEAEIRALFDRRYLEGRDADQKSEQILAARTGKPIEEIRELMRDGNVLDIRLSAEEAKAIGLVDEIIDAPKGLFAGKR